MLGFEMVHFEIILIVDTNPEGCLTTNNTSLHIWHRSSLEVFLNVSQNNNSSSFGFFHFYECFHVSYRSWILRNNFLFLDLIFLITVGFDNFLRHKGFLFLSSSFVIPHRIHRRIMLVVELANVFHSLIMLRKNSFHFWWTK